MSGQPCECGFLKQPPVGGAYLSIASKTAPAASYHWFCSRPCLNKWAEKQA